MTSQKNKVMTKIQKNYLSLASSRVEKMRSTTPDLSKLPRILSPYFKTNIIRDKVLFLNLKNSKKSISISVIENNFGINYYKIYSSKAPLYDIQISATSNKELLTKIIQKYELFN